LRGITTKACAKRRESQIPAWDALWATKLVNKPEPVRVSFDSRLPQRHCYYLTASYLTSLSGNNFMIILLYNSQFRLSVSDISAEQ
jgi:hypothetical protein